MKKILQSTILGLCMSISFTHAAPEALHITATIPMPTIDQIIQNATQQIINTDTVKKLSILSQNAPLVMGSTLLGLMGLDMIRKSLHTMVDKVLDIEKNDNVSYQKLSYKIAIGACLICAADFGIQTILR